MRSSTERSRSFLSIRPCGRDVFELIPRRRLRVDLAKASAALERRGFKISEVSEMALTASGPNEISLFPDGKLLVYPAKSNREAEEIGEALLRHLESEKGCVSEGS